MRKENIDQHEKVLTSFISFLTHFMPLVSFDTPEHIRKPLVFSCFQRVSRETSGMKWVKVGITSEPYSSVMTHFPIHEIRFSELTRKIFTITWMLYFFRSFFSLLDTESSRSQMFFNIGVFFFISRYSQIKHQFWSLFLIKLQASNTGVLLQILWNF